MSSKAIAINPKLRQAFIYRGLANLKEGKNDAAKKDYLFAKAILKSSYKDENKSLQELETALEKIKAK